MATQEKKRGPGRPRKHEPKMAKYHIYVEEGTGCIRWIGEESGRNASASLTTFLSKNEAYLDEPNPFVVVPERNISRISATVDTIRKLTVEAV